MSYQRKPEQIATTVPFKVKSIARVETPEGGDGEWYRYVIDQDGANTIAGVRAGMEADVHRLVGEMVERLNDRCAGKRAPKYGAGAPKKA